MEPERRIERPESLAGAAKAAEDRGDREGAAAAWASYRRVRDGGRDPDELLAEGIELSVMALELSRPG